MLIITPKQEYSGLIEIEGEMDLHSREYIQRSIEKIYLAQNPFLILDLGKVSKIDSFALSVIAALKRKISALGGKLILINLSPAVQSAFEITRISKAFLIYANLQEAQNYITEHTTKN